MWLGGLCGGAIVDIVERLMNMQKELGMNKAQFASKLGLPRSTLQSLYKYRNSPSEQTLETICESLKVTESQLKYGSDELHKLTEEQLALLLNWSKLTEDKKRLFHELIALG
jgi:transcriptional regulator with XRE-family HTH domain